MVIVMIVIVMIVIVDASNSRARGIDRCKDEQQCRVAKM
jgi:hypothetical protein